MEAGCYTLNLYCDQPAVLVIDSVKAVRGQHYYDEFPRQFSAETYTRCRDMARAKGWVFHNNKTHSCPRCVKEKK